MIGINDIIYLYRGASSLIDFDFSNFEFQGGYVLLTVQDTQTKTNVKTYKFTKQEKTTVLFDDELTSNLKISSTRYKYDLMHHVDNERFPQCTPTPVVVFDTIGGIN